MFEIVFAIGAFVAIGATAVGAVLAGLFGPELIDAVRYPVVVALWGARMTDPPRMITSADVSRMMVAVADIATEANLGLDQGATSDALSSARIRWVPATPGGSPGGTLRAIKDPWDRTIHGEPMWVGGYFSQGVCFVVFLENDHIEDTAFHHELAHAILTECGFADSSHHEHQLMIDVRKHARANYAENV